MINAAALKELRASLRGEVLTPADAGYDEVRRIHNGMFVRRPAVIARCLGTADVVDAVRFAREQDLELAVRGGGHSVAGKSVCEGGLACSHGCRHREISGLQVISSVEDRAAGAAAKHWVWIAVS